MDEWLTKKVQFFKLYLVVFRSHFKDNLLKIHQLEKDMELSDRWISVEEVAKYLGISKETVYRWLEKKKIPAHKVGKLWKFQLSEVDNWVKSGQAEVSHA